MLTRVTITGAGPVIELWADLQAIAAWPHGTEILGLGRNRLASEASAPFIALVQKHAAREFIVQASREEEFPAIAALAKLGKVTALFAPSGGRGVEVREFPRPLLGPQLGFAGGIKPSNVLQVLAAIGPREEDFWLDMESGVRTGDDLFDLSLVREVLTLCKDLVPG